MFKTKFYTLIWDDSTGSFKAVLVNGYTDGAFNYYKLGRIWYAIVPAYGRSIAMDSTRKGAARIAFNSLDELRELERTKGENMHHLFLEKARAAATIE